METEAETATGFARRAVDALDEREGSGAGAPSSVRRRAFDEFEAMPMPSPETEEWRYTDLRDLGLDAYEPFAPEPRAETLDDVEPAILEAAGEVGDRAGLAIQHNSTVVTAHLDAEVDGAGVHFESIDDALRDHPELLVDRLHAAVPSGRTRFTALHAAFRTGGTFVLVPRDVKVEAPLQALTYVDRDGLAVFPHTVIVLEQGAELTFIDRYVSPDLSNVFSNAVVELYAGPNSRLSYVSLQEWGSGVTHLAVQRADVDRDASEMLGVYFGDGEQHLDFRSIQDHIGSQTSSDLLYKGALRDRSRAIYSGNVVIRQGAHKCNAYQTNRNILLSDSAKADSIPNLEILSNDPVRCGHAASVGPVDEDTLFYIQSRGISPDEAERLIVFGFFQEVLDRVRLPEVKAGLEAAIAHEIERAVSHAG